MIDEDMIVESFKNEPSPFKFQKAAIDPAYSGGKPKLLFDTETSVSQKRYDYMKSYTPIAGERVLVINDVIIGAFGS